MASDNGSAPTGLVDPVTGRKVRRLTAPPNENMHAYYDIPPWSPDGRRIVYASHVPGADGADIWIMNADGTEARHVATHDRFNPHTACNQKWADDVTIALPSSAGRDGHRLINVEDLTEEFVAVPGGVNKISPDGRLGIATSGDEAGLVDMTTGEYRRICTIGEARAMSPHQDIVRRESSVLLNPRWSHTGQHAIICHRTHNLPQELKTEMGPMTVVGPALVETFLYTVDTGALRYLTRVNHHPTWRRDSESVVFVGRDPVTGRQDLREIGVDDAEPTVIFDAEHVPAGHPLFHPTKPDLLVTDCFGGRYGYGIVLIDLRTQRVELIASMPLGEDPATAPEARAADPHNWHCWSYPRWGTGTRCHPHPAWNADGTELLYVDATGGLPQIHVLDTADL